MPAESTIALAIERFVQDIASRPVGHPLDDVLENALVAEYEIRLLFASDTQDPQLQDPYLGLLNVFDLPPMARRHRERNVDYQTSDWYNQYIFPLSKKQRRLGLMPSTVRNIEAFERNWETFTHRALLKMTSKDWKNVIAAGGSVLACLKSYQDVSTKRMNEIYQSSAYESSDIDLFLWGLTPKEAETKMQDIYRAVCEAAPWKVTCVRKSNTVSIRTAYPYKPIQIILRLYQSPAEILAGFDIDSACCAYDGNRVWVNPRCLTALVRQSNTVDITRRSPSYEMRLAKYADRGFEIFLPTLQRERINPMIYSPELPAFPNGLARLLVLEAARYKPEFYTYLKFPKAHYLQESVGSRLDRQTHDLPSNNYDGNLGWAQIPYGPYWDAEKIEKLIYKKDAWLNSPNNPYNQGERKHKHVFFAGTMQECLRAFCPTCDDSEDAEDDAVTSPGSGLYIKGPVKFITLNPGHQLLTGSFRPIEAGEWAFDAYEI